MDFIELQVLIFKKKHLTLQLMLQNIDFCQIESFDIK